jgi:hypothetical protein
VHVIRLNYRSAVRPYNGFMNDKQQVITVVVTRELAALSLAAANADGMSRSELVRRLLTGYLELNGATDD